MATILRTDPARKNSDPIAELETLAADVQTALAAEHRAHNRLMSALNKAHAEGERQHRLLAR